MNQFKLQMSRLAHSRAARAITAGGMALVAGGAHAAPIDVTAVVTVITDGVVTISSLGIAVLSLVVVIKLFKWMQRAI